MSVEIGNPGDVNGTVAKLFREKTILEVKDYNLELSQRVAKLNDEFRSGLSKQYKDILQVTADVETLHLKMKEVDSQFIELCFNDDKNKLKKMPQMDVDLRKFKKLSNVQNSSNELKSDLDESEKILVLSNWLVAVTDLINRFVTSSSSGKLFDEVMNQFGKVSLLLPTLSDYKPSISKKCEEFQNFIIESFYAGNSDFTLLQWVQVYNLFEKEHDTFPWNDTLLPSIKNLIFEAVFSFDEKETFESTNTVVTKFTQSDAFKKKYIEMLTKDIENKMDTLRKTTEKDSTLTDTDDLMESCLYTQPAFKTLDIQQIIENSKVYSLGLTTNARVEIHHIITPTLTLLSQFQHHGGDREMFTKYVTKLVELLGNLKPVNTESSMSPYQKTVSDFMLSCNNSNYTDYLNQQIKKLEILLI